MLVQFKVNWGPKTYYCIKKLDECLRLHLLEQKHQFSPGLNILIGWQKLKLRGPPGCQ